MGFEISVPGNSLSFYEIVVTHLWNFTVYLIVVFFETNVNFLKQVQILVKGEKYCSKYRDHDEIDNDFIFKTISIIIILCDSLLNNNSNIFFYSIDALF